MASPPGLHSLAVKLSQGHESYRPQSDPAAILGEQRRDFVVSAELKAGLRPENLDGDPETFTRAERRAWAHFQAAHGIILPVGGYMFLRSDVLAPVRSRAELSELYDHYRDHPPSRQWVYLQVENQGAWFDYFKVPKDRERDFEQEFLNELQAQYRVKGQALNIRFTLTPPKHGPHKIIYIVTKPGGTADPCKTSNFGNQDLAGTMVVNLPHDKTGDRSPETLRRQMVATIAHATGHMLGLQHHYVATIHGRDPLTQAMMFADTGRDNSAQHYGFLPENQEYIELFLGRP